MCTQHTPHVQLPHVHVPKADLSGKNKENGIFQEAAPPEVERQNPKSYWYQNFEANPLAMNKNTSEASFDKNRKIKIFLKSGRGVS